MTSSRYPLRNRCWICGNFFLKIYGNERDRRMLCKTVHSGCIRMKLVKERRDEINRKRFYPSFTMEEFKHRFDKDMILS